MKKDIKIDYIGLLKESIKFTWRNKVLWIFGLILAFFSGGRSLNLSNVSNFSGDYNEYDHFHVQYGEVGDKVNDLVSSPIFWLVVVGMIVFMIFITLLSWYLRSVAQIALFDAVVYEEEGKEEKIKFKKLWSGSHSRLLRVFKYGLTWFLIVGLPIVIGTLSFAFAVVLVPVFICAICFLIPLLIVLFLFINLLNAVSFRVLLTKDLSVWGTLKYSYELILANWQKFLVGLLAFWGPMMIVNFALGVFSLMLALVIILPALILAFTSEASLVIIVIGAVLAIVALTFFNAVLMAPVNVYAETYLTKFVRKFLKRSKVIEGNLVE